ncbi:MAG: rhomboid family intramembrane serine protease [Lysobacteraceae bacterium]|nr:MAG: rhomboid family intramembrane serine protease [Xanthomonadaceae bacterium]
MPRPSCQCGNNPIDRWPMAELSGGYMFWLLPWDDENHVKKHAWTVYAMIAANVVVFVLVVMRLMDADDASNAALAFGREYGLLADDWRWHQFMTANFLHGGVEHLVGNMMFLLLFGDNIEDALGPIGFLLIYFLGGLAGDIVYVHNNVGSDVPTVGASGCISAIAGAYCVLFYDRTITVRIMFIVVPILTFGAAAVVVVLLWFGLDLWLTLSGAGQLTGEGGVNYVSHGVGFIFGVLCGVIARVHGVMRRYERLPEGGGWLGYWPHDLERRHRRARFRK